MSNIVLGTETPTQEKKKSLPSQTWSLVEETDNEHIDKGNVSEVMSEPGRRWKVLGSGFGEINPGRPH